MADNRISPRRKHLNVRRLTEQLLEHEGERLRPYRDSAGKLTIGLPKLLRFKRTLSHLEAGQYLEASLEMLNSRWADQVGRRALRLSRVMETGKDVRLSEVS